MRRIKSFAVHISWLLGTHRILGKHLQHVSVPLFVAFFGDVAVALFIAQKSTIAFEKKCWAPEIVYLWVGLQDCDYSSVMFQCWFQKTVFILVSGSVVSSNKTVSIIDIHHCPVTFQWAIKMQQNFYLPCKTSRDGKKSRIRIAMLDILQGFRDDHS